MVTIKIRSSLSLFRLILNPYAALLFAAPVLAQTDHFTFKANTEDSYAIVVQRATINDSLLQPADEIGVFTPAGLCVGAVTVEQDSNTLLTAWEDDSFTPEVDGFVPGEGMEFRVWDGSSQVELIMEPSYVLGNGTFGNGPYTLVVLSRTNFNFPPRTTLAERYAFNEDTTFELNLDTLVVDENHHDSTLTWTVSPGVNLTSSILPGRIARFEPQPDWFGSEEFTFTATDTLGAADTATVVIEVIPVNDQPVLSLPDTVAIAEDDSSVVLFLDNYVSDVETQPADMQWDIAPDENLDFSFDAQQRTLRLLPARDFNGFATLSLTATDADGGSASDDLLVNVTPVQEQPQPAVPLTPVGGVEVDPAAVTLAWRAASDPDGDILSYTAVYST